jgi:hypothetical protein
MTDFNTFPLSAVKPYPDIGTAPLGAILRLSITEPTSDPNHPHTFPSFGMRAVNPASRGVAGVVTFGEEASGRFFHDSALADAAAIDVSSLVELMLFEADPLGRRHLQHIAPGGVYSIFEVSRPCIAVCGANNNIIGFLLLLDPDKGHIIQGTPSSFLGQLSVRTKLAGTPAVE